MEKILNDLRIQIEKNITDKEPLDWASWQQAKGVILSTNQAQQIIDSYDRLKEAYEKQLVKVADELYENGVTRDEIDERLNYLRIEAGLLAPEKGEEG